MTNSSEKAPKPEVSADAETLKVIGATGVRYRSEHSRRIDDAEKYRALDELKRIGVLAPLTEVDTYHGRLGKRTDQEEWQVDPYFQNGFNDSGNYNLHNAPSLYTSDRAVAHKFAVARGWNEYGKLKGKGQRYWQRSAGLDPGERKQQAQEIGQVFKQEIHTVMSNDTDATVIRKDFNYGELSESDQVIYAQSMRDLLRLVPLTDGAPLEFGSDPSAAKAIKVDSAREVLKRFSSLQKLFINRDDIQRVVTQTGLEESTVARLAAAGNAYAYIFQSPFKAARLMLDSTKDIVSEPKSAGSDNPIPISTEYIQRFFREAHIVGQESGANSATISQTIGMVALFDLQKVNTDRQYEKERQSAAESLLPIGRALEDKLPRSGSHPIFTVLEGVYEKPSKLIRAAKSVPGYAKIFEADAGNWEGYRLEEHTETTLRNFDENFADKVPVELLAPMRLALLTHDIGKPIAVSKGEKHREEAYNDAAAGRFFHEIGISPEVSTFIRNMTSKSMPVAAEAAVFGRDNNLPKLRRFASTELQRITGEPVTESMIDGYLEMCEMLVTCDGGAYTRMATTRRSKVMHRNYRSFDGSFVSPAGPGKRDLRLKRGGIAKRSRQ